MKNVAALIITYNPDNEFGERLSNIVKEVAHVVIVDNHSDIPLSHMFDKTILEKVEIIGNEQNKGIATALNQGVSRVAELGYEWVLLLDQDTVIDIGITNTLISIYHRYPFKERVGIIGPNFRSKHSGRLFIECERTEDDFLELKTVVTSGSLMSIMAYRHAGPFRDDFFIEAVDLEYCLRLRKFGFKILFSCQPLMTHSAGEMQECRFFGKTVIVPNHATWRYYYMVRNLTLTMRFYFWQELGWVFTALINLLKTLIKTILFEERRTAKFVYVWQGFWDAMLKPDYKKICP